MKKLIGVIIFLILSVNILFAENKPYTLNGDVRVKSQSNWKQDYEHRLKCEATIGLDYRFLDAWMQTKLKVSNPLESTETSITQLEIQQLLIGYSLFSGENSFLFIEMGRNKLKTLFESKLEFDNHFNGLNVSYSYETNNGCIIIHGGPHIINSDMDHYGFIGEIIVANPLATNFIMKYSINDWTNHNQYTTNYAFLITQALCKYQLNPQIEIYGAYLRNHKAKYCANGFYIGATYGAISKAKDMMVDLIYQYIQCQAVPQIDRSGIGTGIQLKTAYAVTDNFSIQGKICTTKCAELSAIYKW